MVDVTAFPRCPALDGYHCQTNALAKIYHYHTHPLSEDMLLGLGAGMGFIYWQMKGNPSLNIPDFVFIGGRGNNKHFFEDIGKRTGVKIHQYSTTSEKKAEEAVLSMLRKQIPVMVFGDMGFLPWFTFPTEYHFGGHTFVVCGFDKKNMVLASDMDQKASGLKKGFYHTLSLEQLRKARGSPFKPFPPKNTYLTFDFNRYHSPTKDDMYDAIHQTIKDMLHPPISNMGVEGIRKTAKMLLKWPKVFSDHDLRMNLFTLYVFIEIGGTGGGCFRHMYARFLREASKISKNPSLATAAGIVDESAKLFTTIGLLFKDALACSNIEDRIAQACKYFQVVADKETEAYILLQEHIT